VLVGVMPPPLLRVVEYLFRKHPDIQIVARPRQARNIARHACRYLPDMIVINQRLLGKEALETIAQIKRCSPGSKLILIRSDDVRGGRRYGADAYLAEEAIVRRLLVVVQRLAEERKVGISAGQGSAR
jgi:DNA-binding NarL/FixJ family response regulator